MGYEFKRCLQAVFIQLYIVVICLKNQSQTNLTILIQINKIQQVRKYAFHLYRIACGSTGRHPNDPCHIY